MFPFPGMQELLNRVRLALVKNPAYPDITEPILSEYLKANIIVPVKILGTASGITGGGNGQYTNVPTTAGMLSSSSVAIKYVVVQAKIGNTGWVQIGLGSNDPVVRLYAEDIISIEIDSLRKVYVYSENGTENLSYFYGT